MRFPEWAWAVFLRWALNPALIEGLTKRQRWEVVAWSIGPGIRHHYIRPAEAWLHRHLPTWILIPRLRPLGSGWYRIPSTSAALHLERRLGVHVLEDHFVRIEHGRVTAIGLIDEDHKTCEFWYVDEWVTVP